MLHLMFMILLVITGSLDLMTRKINNLFPLLIALLAVCRVVCDPSCVWSRIAGCLIVSIPLLLLTLRFGGLGGGDVKLTAACGLYLGVDSVLKGCFFAAVFALISYFIRFLYKKECDQTFAFGPYLAAGFILASFL